MRSTGIGLAIASAALFGASTPIAKLLLGAVSPLMLAGLLYAGSGAGLLVVLTARRIFTSHRSLMVLPARADRGWLALAIVLGGVIAPVALMTALATTAAPSVSLLLNLESVFTALFAWFLFRENFDRRVAFGMTAIVAGGLVLAWTPGAYGSGIFGALLVATACICWALDNNLTRKVSGGDAITTACLKGLAAAAVNLGLPLLVGEKVPAPSVIGAALAVGFLGYGVSLALFVLALRSLGGARAGAYFAVAPFFGAAVAFAIQSEPLTWQFTVAGALMAVGVWLHLTERHEHRHAHEWLQHDHSHVHDEHHRHDHDAWDGAEPHTHMHTHAPMVHTHPHYPDLHHRHRH